MSDLTLRQEVLDELEWEPSVNAAHIGVAVASGVVTLTGHVGSYAEKIAAEKAAKRVAGVRAVAQEIEVRFSHDKQMADDQIAKRAIDIISWSTTIPANALRITVEHGWVTLTGTVDWGYQRTAAENAVRQLSGIKGVINAIDITPRVAASNVKQSIEKAIKRSAELDADTIKVSVSGGKVTLSGRVKAWYEREIAERTAWAAPGVTAVEDRIAIG